MWQVWAVTYIDLLTYCYWPLSDCERAAVILCADYYRSHCRSSRRGGAESWYCDVNTSNGYITLPWRMIQLKLHSNDRDVLFGLELLTRRPGVHPERVYLALRHALSPLDGGRFVTTWKQTEVRTRLNVCQCNFLTAGRYAGWSEARIVAGEQSSVSST